MDLKFLLCFIFASPVVLGGGYHTQNSNPLADFDRARSAWNFGGTHPMRSRQWIRPKNVAGPGVIIANSNRRLGDNMRTNAWNLPSSAVSRRKPSSPTLSSISSRQSKPFQKANKPKNKPKTMPRINRNSSTPRQRYPMRYPTNHFAVNPRPLNNGNKKPGLPKTMSSMRQMSSRRMDSRSDNILNRFRKEDLWHLDKGEEYEVNPEDLIIDSILRNPENYEISNELYDEHEHKQTSHEHEEPKEHENHSLDHDIKKTLEMQAEKMVNETENNGLSTGSHIHHHHHYDINFQHVKANDTKKKEDGKTKIIPAPLPRIHLPIPLGCLLALPTFHPIRPRHHLSCLLSIPGTPNLMKKRRKRSTDPQHSSNAQTPAQFLRMFDMNSRMSTPIGGLRKHFSNHVGNGKNQRPMNLKVPATIIAPPQFENTDIMDMLLGSGRVSPNEMGTVLATNSRYVRFGRGLPGSSTRARGRGGRALFWFSDSPANNIRSQHIPSFTLPPSPPVPQPVLSSNPPPSNPTPAKTQPLPAQVQQHQNFNHAQSPPKPALSPTITIRSSPLSPTPTISVMSQVKPTASANASPNVILNVQISPPAPVRGPPLPQRQSSRPIVTHTEPQPQQQQVTVSHKQQQPSYASQTLSVSPSGKSKKKDNFKYSEYWQPVKNEQPHKTYNNDYHNNNDVYESADLKINYQKHKPEKKQKNKKKNNYSSKYYDKIDNHYSYGNSDDHDNDLYSYSSTSKQKSPNYYQTSNSVPLDSQDMSSLLNYYNGNNGENEYTTGDAMDITTPAPVTFSYDLPQSEPNYFSDPGYSYAFKKESEEYNADLNNVYYVDSATVGTFSNTAEGVLDKSSLHFQENPYSAYDIIEEDNEMDGGRKYYMVKKLQIQEPIIVHVPKDSLSNEIK